MKFFRFLVTVSFLAFPAAWLQAELIPASRLTTWTPGVTVGVTGGIPTNRTTLIDVTQSPYNADKTGTNDCSSAIASAIDAANGTGKVVYLPAGTYKVASPINKTGKSNFTIRGDGDTTVINLSGGGAASLWLGQTSDWGTGVAISSGLTAGTTVLTLANVSGFAAGQLVRIEEQNDLAFPVVAPNNGAYTRYRSQTAIITNVNSSAKTITISRGLLWTLQSGLTPTARPISYNVYATGIGVENLKINATNSTASFTIWMEDCTQSWVKNVHFVGSYNYSLYLLACCNIEVRHCNLDTLNHSGPNGSLMIVEQTGDSLVEDNIFYQASTHMEYNYGCTGNVFAYNFMQDSTIIDTVGISIDSNHGPHNSYNLYEGNISPKFECDGYFGGASEDTVFRNWFHGTSPGANNQHPMLLKRFTRNYNVVGNILGKSGQSYGSIYNIGYPNIGNDSYTGTASLINGRPWADWAAYLAGTYTAGTAGFQELDQDVQATLTLKGNWNSVDGRIPAGESLGSDPLPSSLYLAGKPTWFGNLAYPPFDPSSPNQSIEAIPAGYRYVHGIDPPGGLVQGPSNATTIITIQ